MQLFKGNQNNPPCVDNFRVNLRRRLRVILDKVYHDEKMTRIKFRGQRGRDKISSFLAGGRGIG